MRNIVVTGATSFIGVNLIKELLLKDVRIYAVVRPDSPKIKLLPRTSKIVIVQADMDNYNRLSNHIHEPCDCLIHLAWNGTRGASRMDKTLQSKNYKYSMEALGAALKTGCNTFISAGSQAEYGNHNTLITEESTCCPNTEYGIQKFRFYKDALKICKENNMHFKESRYFSLYGHGDYEGTLVMSTLKKMLHNETCEFTESKQTWDFLYITDAVKGIEKLIETDCPDGAYNFGSGLSRTLKDYIEEMSQITQSRSKLIFGAIPYPSTGIVSIQPCIDKITSETGWFPKTTFNDGILNIIESMKCEE